MISPNESSRAFRISQATGRDVNTCLQGLVFKPMAEDFDRHLRLGKQRLSSFVQQTSDPLDLSMARSLQTHVLQHRPRHDADFEIHRLATRGDDDGTSLKLGKNLGGVSTVVEDDEDLSLSRKLATQL